VGHYFLSNPRTSAATVLVFRRLFLHTVCAAILKL